MELVQFAQRASVECALDQGLAATALLDSDQFRNGLEASSVDEPTLGISSLLGQIRTDFDVGNGDQRPK